MKPITLDLQKSPISVLVQATGIAKIMRGLHEQIARAEMDSPIDQRWDEPPYWVIDKDTLIFHRDGDDAIAILRGRIDGAEVAEVVRVPLKEFPHEVSTVNIKQFVDKWLDKPLRDFYSRGYVKTT